MDDASRVCCHGQFLAENVDTLIEALRAAFYKRGVPQSLYVDNGSIYTSKEIIQIARVGCLLAHTPMRDGAAKGKIERFFRTVRDQFLSLKLDLICLELLNRQFTHWVEEQHNAPVHSVLGMPSLDRFALDRNRIRLLPPNEANDELFFVEEDRQVRLDNRTLHTYHNTLRIPCEAFQIEFAGRDHHCEGCWFRKLSAFIAPAKCSCRSSMTLT